MSDRTQDLKNLRAVATACKNYVDETKEQILWQVGQYNITTQDDNTTTYQKVVPTGATRVKIKSIGGMSYKSENLILSYEQGTYATQGLATRVAYNFGSKAQTITIKAFNNDFQYIVQRFVKGTRTYVDNVVNWSNTTQTITTDGTNDYVIIVARMESSVNLRPTDINYVMAVNGSTAPTEFKQGFAGIRDSVITKITSRKQALRDLRLTQIGAYTFTGNETLTEYTRSNDNKKTYACAINGRATTTDVFFENLSLSTATTMNNMEDNSYRGAIDTTSVIFYSTSYQTSASMLTFLTGKTIYYKLATELETPQQEVVDYFVIDTYTIPDEVKALEGYGRGINSSVYNVLDLDTKVFTDKDNTLDIGALTYTKSASGLFQGMPPSDIKHPSANTQIPNLLSAIYTPIASRDIYGPQSATPSPNGVMALAVLDYLFFNNTDYTDTSEFKTAMNGVNLQYELATYNTTDNLELPDNVIEVEEGGYLVFENQYQQAVPSNITYRIEVAK